MRATVITYFNPVVAVLLGVAVLRELARILGVFEVKPAGSALVGCQLVWTPDFSQAIGAASPVRMCVTDDDGGQTWRNGNKNLYPRYMPEEAREETLERVGLRPQDVAGALQHIGAQIGPGIALADHRQQFGAELCAVFG